MAVLIKNMEMPDCCGYCPQFVKLVSFNFFDNSCLCRFGGTPPEPWPMRYEKRADDCPLIPVPEHGRLGDLDELKDRVTKRLYASNHGSMAEAYYSALIDMIDSAPTIIPADKPGDS